MTCKAYYNENDKLAAQWLRELIAFDLIAPGDVDERSIRKVKAKDLRGYTQHHFFAGIGVWSYALRNAGWPDDFPVWTGSCPCQSFSASGKRQGFSDRRHLWPAWFRLIRELQPHVVIGEQVSKKDGLAWLDLVSSDLEGEAYTFGALDTSAAGVGAPHIRSRLYWVAESRRGVWSPWSERNEQQREESIGAGSAGRSKTRKLAESDKARRVIEREARAHHQWTLWNDVDRRSEHGGVADTECDGRWTDEQRRGSQERIADGRISASELADTASDHGRPGKRGAETGTGKNRKRRRGFASGGDDGLGDTIGERSQGHAGDGDRGEKPEAVAPGSVAATSASFWSNMRWLYCSDGKYRPFPAEPSLFPLAPRTAGRVGLLRGAGNSLCAPQAVAFIQAYMNP